MCSVTAPAHLRVPPQEASVGRARAFLADRVCQEHSAGLSATAVLLVSELVTNAVRHGGPPIDIEVICDQGADLQVRVRDAGPELPEVGDLDLAVEGGRGVAMVDLLSDAWGVDSHAGDGKTVWFCLSTSPSAACRGAATA